MDDAEIGDECIVGAMAFVKAASVFPKRSLIVGNPAKVIKTDRGILSSGKPADFVVLDNSFLLADCDCSLQT